MNGAWVWGLWGASTPVLAGDNLSVTSLGASGVREQAIPAQSVDLLLGQRLRWTIATGTRALVDGRFAIDPTGTTTFEESRVRELGVSYDTEKITLLLGRHPVAYGGPRLVDGAQALYRVDEDGALEVGAWTGLVPDEFTTVPTLRYGVGPIVAYNRTAWSASAMGDFTFGTGAAPRAAVLALGRGEVGRVFGASGRLDVVFSDGVGHAGLADGSVFLQARPADVLKIDALYDAYSSLLYQTRASVDPTVLRFAARIEELGLAEGITQDIVDPSLHHLLGATVTAQGTGGVRPVASVRGRAQLHRDPAERYLRAGVLLGLVGIADDRLELDVDANAASVDGHFASDAGATVVVEPAPDAVVVFDGSFRVLLDPVEFSGKPGWYSDLFVDVVSRGGTTVSAGGSWTLEPSDVVGSDAAFGAYLRLQQWIRPGRTATRPATPVTDASDSTPSES